MKAIIMTLSIAIIIHFGSQAIALVIYYTVYH